jgi:hypothetical protein
MNEDGCQIIKYIEKILKQYKIILGNLLPLGKKKIKVLKEY